MPPADLFDFNGDEKIIKGLQHAVGETWITIEESKARSIKPAKFDQPAAGQTGVKPFHGPAAHHAVARQQLPGPQRPVEGFQGEDGLFIGITVMLVHPVTDAFGEIEVVVGCFQVSQTTKGPLLPLPVSSLREADPPAFNKPDLGMRILGAAADPPTKENDPVGQNNHCAGPPR